ncbi:MAG: 2-phospho-L-lactate guanylyltransferase [Acidimicrobiales bacterium]|nr:2-phospho-L-lactate guanylyltransferase [Acidimicrobiales bacterium]
MQAAVVVPVKAFRSAKRRLATVLSPDEREDLARFMAARVVAAAGDAPVTVVCDDEDVRSWATEAGARTLWTPGLGLDGAVTAGVADAADRGADRVVVAHADLPFARDLSTLFCGDGVSIVPDRHGDGTNVIAVPSRAGFRFSYGPGSFGRHVATANDQGLAVEILSDPDLGWDVDIPSDLDLPGGLDLMSVLR